MPFVEDPACLSKSRLKSDLVAHNVELPPAGSKKEAYVALHLRHVDQTNAADFSSDDDQEHNVAVSLSIYSFFFFFLQSGMTQKTENRPTKEWLFLA